jgi:hypothetical protein
MEINSLGLTINVCQYMCEEMCHHGPQVIAQVIPSAEAGKRKKLLS